MKLSDVLRIRGIPGVVELLDSMFAAYLDGEDKELNTNCEVVDKPLDGEVDNG